MSVSVRYIVNDVDAAISFYTEMLGFKVDIHPAATFAIISKDDFRLMLSRPGGSGGAGRQWRTVKFLLPAVGTAFRLPSKTCRGP